MLDKLDLFDEILLFSTVKDFMNKRYDIKEIYVDMDDRTRSIYRMYVSSRPFIPDYFRGKIWDWLNDYMNDLDIMLDYRVYLRKYGEALDE